MHNSPSLPILIAVAAAILCGCAHGPVVEAPVDGYVCADASFQECLAANQAALADSVRETLYGRFFNKNQSPVVLDPNAGKTLTSQDKTKTCQYGAISYHQQIDLADKQKVVIVPTGLLLAIGEAMVQLEHLRHTCDQAIDDYDFQVGALMTQQNAQSDAQVKVQQLNSAIEHENLSHMPVTSLDKDWFGSVKWAQNHSWKGSLYFPDAMLALRDSLTSEAVALRNLYLQESNGTYGADGKGSSFNRQFTSVQDSIDQQLRVLSRLLSQLDVGAYPVVGGNIGHLLVASGSWAQQGTPIATTRKP